MSLRLRLTLFFTAVLAVSLLAFSGLLYLLLERTLASPTPGNANFTWVQHFVYHLAPTGIASFVLANGSMSSNQSGEGEIRKNIRNVLTSPDISFQSPPSRSRAARLP